MQNLKSQGLYSRIVNALWHALIDNKITSLPVSVIKIANNNEIKVLKNSDAQELREGERGVSIFDGGEWYIVYDDSPEHVDYKRFVVAHELGHILLGHPLIAGYHARTNSIPKPRTEKEADSFARRLLSPACVLWGLNLRTAAEINRACELSLDEAKPRANRMRELYKRNKFLTSPLEKDVYEQFKAFIEQNK